MGALQGAPGVPPQVRQARGVGQQRLAPDTVDRDQRVDGQQQRDAGSDARGRDAKILRRDHRLGAADEGRQPGAEDRDTAPRRDGRSAVDGEARRGKRVRRPENRQRPVIARPHQVSVPQIADAARAAGNGDQAFGGIACGHAQACPRLPGGGGKGRPDGLDALGRGGPVHAP